MKHHDAVNTMKLAIGLGIVGAAYDERGEQIPIVWENVIESVYRTLRHPDFIEAVKQVAIEASTQPAAKRFKKHEQGPIIGYGDYFGARNTPVYLDLSTRKPYHMIYGKRAGIIDETGKTDAMIARYYAKESIE